MMTENRTEREIAQAARELTEIEDELRDIHGSPIAEYQSMTVFADTHGHEHKEIAKAHNDRHGTDLTAREVGVWMHEQTKGVNHSWSVADPVVVLHD